MNRLASYISRTPPLTSRNFLKPFFAYPQLSLHPSQIRQHCEARLCTQSWLPSTNDPSSKMYQRRAEWMEHKCTVLAWPDDKIPYYHEDPEAFAAATNDVCSIADAVAQFEPVKLLVGETRLEEARKRFHKDSSRKYDIEIHAISGGQLDLWMRDIAPIFVTEKATGTGKDVVRGVDFNYNGWGGKIQTETCSKLAKTLLSDMQVGRVASTVTTEGGAIETDGEGTMIASESSIINDNRNPGKSRKDIEAEFSRNLGIKKFLWVPGLRDHETTDFHIDAVARFARPGLILFGSPNEKDDDDWAKAHRQARDILAGATDASGRQLEIIDITEPPVEEVAKDEELLKEMIEGADEGSRWVFSYVNYLLVNGGVIFPQFGAEEADAKALKTAREIFADRKVVPVMVRELGIIGGGIHCASQEVPLVRE